MMLRRAAFVTGISWIVRGLVGSSLIPSPRWMIAAQARFLRVGRRRLLTVFGAWPGFLLYWLVPFCTWHIAVQYVRLICEHSAVESDEDEYAITRTTDPDLARVRSSSCRATSAFTSSITGTRASPSIGCPSCTSS